MSDRRLAELEALAGPVSRETFERLLAFEQSFLKWARRINLAAPSTLEAVWPRHILDSAQLVQLAPSAKRWLDLGTGGGFPGAVVAMLLADRPGASVDLIESSAKKAAFVQAALAEAGVAARIHRRRIEDCAALIPTPDIVTARALARLPRLIALAEPWLAAGARGLFHKGRDYLLEIEESRALWRFDLIEHADRVDPEGIILEVANPRRL